MFTNVGISSSTSWDSGFVDSVVPSGIWVRFDEDNELSLIKGNEIEERSVFRFTRGSHAGAVASPLK
jgi:hypothetical protein